MAGSVNLWPLIGVAIIAVGFALRLNPMLAVIVATVATAFAGVFAGGFNVEHVLTDVEQVLTTIGKGFLATRNLPLIIFMPLAVIGLLERHGLRQQAQKFISGIKAATAGRLLIVYLALRQLTAALGLTSLGGHPQMVRPLIAPMAEGATENRFGALPDRIRHLIRAYAAAADNVGLFFGEDIFVAFGAIVLMTTFLDKAANISVPPIHVALWGIPTALAAFTIHAWRTYRLDGKLAKELEKERQKSPSEPETSAPAHNETGK